jgi:hypothetical protein
MAGEGDNGWMDLRWNPTAPRTPFSIETTAVGSSRS